MALYKPGDQLPVKRKLNLRKAYPSDPEVDLPDVGANTHAQTLARISSASASTTPASFDVKGAAKVVDSITPYASNIINAFRKPPKPALPTTVASANISSPSLANERVEIDRSVHGADLGADKGLDSNTAAAVKAGNLIQGLRAKGQSYSNEANLGVQTRNASAQINASIDAMNSGKMDQYNEQKLGMEIAGQREQSENIANAADKRVAEIARRDAMGLDKTKFSILSKMYTSGVLDRLTKKVAGKDTVSSEDLDKILHGDFSNGGHLSKPGDMIPGLFPRKARLRKVAGTPIEMAVQYKLANGGKLLGESNVGPCPNPPCDPIYTNNPKDPRLQAYNDSLTLHNYGVSMDEQYNKMKQRDPQMVKYEHHYKYGEHPSIDDFGNLDEKFGKIKPIDYYYNNMWNNPKAGETKYRWLNGMYKKPVQPVIYQKPQQQNQQQYTYDSLGMGMKTPKRIQGLPANAQLRLTRDDGTQNWAPNPNSKYADITATPIPQKPIVKSIPQRPKGAMDQVNIPSHNLSTGARPTPGGAIHMPNAQLTSPTPTKYAFAYPDENGQQRNVYFKTQDELDNFSKGARGVSSQQGTGYKTATGYLADGGGLTPIAKTQGQVDAANMEAQRFMKSRGFKGANYYSVSKVGDALPQYIGADNKPFSQLAAAPLPLKVPSYVNATDIQNSNGQFFYTDQQSGSLVQVDPSVVNLPRFRKPMIDVATRRNGGYIGGSILHTPKMNNKGKLRRAY